MWEPDDAAVLTTTMTDQKPDAILSQAISLTDIARDPQHYVLPKIDFDHLERLTDMPITTYIHSNGEPLGDYDPRFAQLKDWLEAHHIPLQFIQCLGSCWPW